MHLVAFSVEGYRRFVDKTAVKLHDDLIAFVGPNEAGKSSLLQALAHLNSADPFEQNERPRRTTITPKLAWHFQLKDDDREALAAVPDASHIERLVIAKSADGSKTWDFKPRSPLRDRTNRKSAAELLKAHRDSEPLGVADEDESSEFRLEDYDKAVETLEADVENYLAEHLEGLRGLAVRIRQVDHQFSTDEADEATTPQDDEPTMAWLADRDALADALDLVADQESATSPWHLAVAALKPRVPEILTFEDEDRDLASQYDLTELGGEPPAALGHLAGLANLDLKMLRSEAMAGAVADVTTRRNAANANLTAAFEQSWNQQGIAVQIEVQGTILHVQATTPEDSGVSDIAERSDGMRWFAALLAFAHGWERQPILLVDEIERHLHYDAQADLIEVLSKQEFTSK
jgi:predicted ATPase